MHNSSKKIGGAKTANICFRKFSVFGEFQGTYLPIPKFAETHQNEQLWAPRENLWVSRTIMGNPTHRSKIEVFNRQGVLLDELATRLHHIAHQLGKDVIRIGQITHLYLQQGAGFMVQRGFPQLIGVHFA